MKVNLVIKERPTFSSFTVFEKINYDKLRETKTVDVDSQFVTKTRISTSLQIGKSRHGINLAIDGFRTDEVRETNYLSGGVNVSNYFKKLKSQGVERYKEYVIEAIKIVFKDYLHVTLDEVTVNLILPDFN